MATAKNEVIGEVILKNVRLSFADIYRPAKDRVDKKTGETIKGKYGANAGLFCLNVGHGASDSNTNIGGRLAKV